MAKKVSGNIPKNSGTAKSPRKNDLAAPVKDDQTKTGTDDYRFYRVPLYYDMAFERDVSTEIDYYTRMFDEYCDTKVKRVLEPACGTGLYLEYMSKAGYEILGYDLSPEMVRYSQDRIKRSDLDGNAKARVKVIEGDMRTIKFDQKFDAAINQINSLGYLVSDKDIIDHFKVTADALADGAIYIIEVTLKCDNFEHEHKPEETWTSEREGVFLETTWKPTRYDSQKKIRYVDFDLNVTDHGKKMKFHEVHELRLWTHDDIKRLASAGGFKLVKAYFGDFTPIPDETVITGEIEFPYFILKKI